MMIERRSFVKYLKLTKPRKMFEEIRYKLKRKLFRNMENYEVTLEELKDKQLDGAQIIDVRNNREYEEQHIEGSINVPEYEIDENFKNIVKNKDKPIVVYCETGFRSLKAYKKLKELGYNNVYSLYGGLENY